MNKFIASILMLFSLSSFAKPIGLIGNLADGKASMVLHDTPCTSEIALKRVKTDARAIWMHGEYQGSDGKKIIACWAPSRGFIVISDEEGDVGQLPMNLVQPIDNS